MKAAVHYRYGSPEVVVDSLARQGMPRYARLHFGLRRPRFPSWAVTSPG